MINKDKQLIDLEGRTINEKGHYVDKDGNRVDIDGHQLSEDGNYVLTAKYEDDRPKVRKTPGRPKKSPSV